MTSGRVMFKYSLHPSYSSPPKSAADKFSLAASFPWHRPLLEFFDSFVLRLMLLIHDVSSLASQLFDCANIGLIRLRFHI